MVAASWYWNEDGENGPPWVPELAMPPAGETVKAVKAPLNALRPWVAATSMLVVGLKTRSSTGTLGSPVLNGVHDVPPLFVWNTPRSVPIRIWVVGALGSSRMALTGMLGR